MDSPAQVAYGAYGHAVEHKNFRGEAMPEFEDLPEKIQAAWNAAAEAVLDNFRCTDCG